MAPRLRCYWVSRLSIKDFRKDYIKMKTNKKQSGEWGSIAIQPEKLIVGQYGSWTISYTVGQHPIEEGGDIRIRPYGNPLVRPPGQADIPYEENYVTVSTPPHVKVSLVCNDWLIVTATVLKGKLVEGDEIIITYGDQRDASPGFRLKSVVYDLRFRVSIKVNSDTDPMALTERPMLQLIPDKPSKLLVKTTSVLSGDEDIDVLIRSADQYGNTVKMINTPLHIPGIPGLNMPDKINSDIERDGYTMVRCSRTGKLPEKRIRIAVCDNSGQIVARSNPIEANVPEEEDRIFWGDIHCHSELEQGLESVEFLYKYARDQEKLDFVAHVEHQMSVKTRWTGKHFKTWNGGVPSVKAYNEETWEYRKELVRKYYKPGRFVPFLALEWASNVYGHVNVYYPDTSGPVLYPISAWAKNETPDKLWKALEEYDAIVIPHHPSCPVGTSKPPDYMALGGYDWDYYNPKLMRLVEIYSKHGSAEYFGCPRPPLNQQAEGTVRTALDRGYKPGFMASSDTQASRPGSDLYQDHTYSQSGLTAVFAPKLDRESIFQALKARRCYATTGQRIILRFWLNGCFMGEEIQLKDAAEVKEIRVEVATVGDLETVEVLKNGKTIYCYNGHLTPGLGWWRDNGWEMETRVLDKEITKDTDYYYVRVTQKDGGMAWSSPVWVSSEAEL